MGNLSFIVPTKRVEEFNIVKIGEMISEKFPDVSVDVDIKFKEIRLEKNGELISKMYFEQDCYILDYEEDIEQLNEMNRVDLSDKLKDLELLRPNLDNIVQTTHGSFRLSDLRFDIEDSLRKYFETYTFDEGIHPEFIPPDYVRKQTNKSLWANLFD